MKDPVSTTMSQIDDQLSPMIGELIKQHGLPIVGRSLLRLAATVAGGSFDLDDQDISRLSNDLECTVVEFCPSGLPGCWVMTPSLRQIADAIENNSHLEDDVETSRCRCGVVIPSELPNGEAIEFCSDACKNNSLMEGG